MRAITTFPIRDHNQESCMPANEGLAYISLPRCGSKLARSLASPSTNSLLILWLHCPSCVNDVTRNLFAVKWPGGRRQNQKQAEPEFFLLSDVGLVKGELLSLLTYTCMRVGKSRPPSVTEISSQIATGCSCFWQEVRALRQLHKSNLFANWCTNEWFRVAYSFDLCLCFDYWAYTALLINFMVKFSDFGLIRSLLVANYWGHMN